MSVIYRSIITSKFRTENLLNFFNTVGDEADEHTIYVTFGRDESWGDNESSPNFAPPYPDDNTDGIVDVWTRMLGAVKVPQEMLQPVATRRDWGDIRYQDSTTFRINDFVVMNSAPYNITVSGAGWMVYRVVDVPDFGACSITSLEGKEECLASGGIWTPSDTSAIRPTERQDAIDTGDGYLWEYLYTIPADVAVNQCTNEHIVIPTPSQLKEDPVRWGYDQVLTWYPEQYDLVHRMKVNTLRFRAYLDSVYFPQASAIGNNGFRQISVIMDPYLAKDVPSDGNVKATGNYMNPIELEAHSGEMIYMENRQPIIRSRDQTEEFNLIFEF